MTVSLDLRNTVLLSLQRAMLGEVFPALRGINVEITGNEIVLLCYVDESINESDRESLSEIETELLADLPSAYKTHVEIILPIQDDEGVPDRGIPVYRRK